MSADETYWTDKEVASYLRISLASVRRKRAYGDGPEFRYFGGCVRYEAAAVKQWARAQRGGNVVPSPNAGMDARACGPAGATR
jgi:hypothetical protein